MRFHTRLSPLSLGATALALAGSALLLLAACRDPDAPTSAIAHSDRPALVRAALAASPQIDAGEEHACALRSQGTVVCWGNGTDGRTTPPSGLTDVTQVSAGHSHSCAVKTNG